MNNSSTPKHISLQITFHNGETGNIEYKNIEAIVGIIHAMLKCTTDEKTRQ